MAGRIRIKGAKGHTANPVAFGGKWGGRRNKYNAIKTKVGGLTFDSKAEAKQWVLLQMLAKAGAITDLRRQVPFTLEVNEVKLGKIILDFVYKNKAGETVYEDVKSPATITPMFRWKAKHLKAQYGITVKLVTK